MTIMIQPLNKIPTILPETFSTGVIYLDNILGGGFTAGSTLLCAGLPGSGKSTLMLQVSYNIAQNGRRVLYIAGEESKTQIKMRADRLAINSDKIFLSEDIVLEDVIKVINEIKPDLVIVDSLQMLNSRTMRTAPGTPSQIRYGLMTLCELSKSLGITIVFVGHSTKGGYIAGLQTYQHMVDVTFYMGINEDDTRYLRVIKNRFGQTGITQSLYISKYGIFENENSEKPFGMVKNVILSPEEAVQKTEGRFMKFLVSSSMAWIKKEARKYPVFFNEGVVTLTPSNIDTLTKNHPLWKPLVNKTMVWLKEKYE